MHVRLRQAWLQAHRWFALGLGWMLALQGLMGAALVVARPMERWLHPELFEAPAVDARAVAAPGFEALRTQLAGHFGRGADFTFRPPRDPGDTLWVLVRGSWAGTVYLDPASGRELGRLAETDGFANIVFRTHSSLWLGDTGKALLAWIALGYLFLLTTGLVLWWPRRWPPTLRVRFDKGTLAAFFDLHRTAGALLGLLIAVSVATGAYMAWRPIGDVITWIAGAAVTKPPPVPKPAGPPSSRPGLDVLVATAKERFPGAPIGYVQVPSRLDRPVRVRFMLAGDPHPNGLSSVWLDPNTGQVLGALRWNELDPGARAVAVVYPLHTGVLGGPLLEAVVAIGGATLGLLGITGLWLWWTRRGNRRKTPSAHAPS
jgi:uncharacterized iron-regulated membrane protein